MPPESPPSALDTAGPFADPLAGLSWTLFWMAAIVLAIVVAATAVALFGRKQLKAKLGREWVVVVGGVAFPGVVLSALLVYGLVVTAQVSAAPTSNDIRIRVAGEMWWWRVQYLGPDGQTMFETANEIRVPVGRPFTLQLESSDVIHAFWVPQLGPKRDMIPGRTNLLRLQADRPGVFRGQCSEYCGGAHALMANEVIAVSPADYETWAARQIAAADPGGAGWELFASSGCGACHTVRGTDANGRIGPDLTHVAGRRTIAAGIVPNTPENLRAFIRHPGDFKPGLRMPDYERLSEADVDSIAAWLETLQ